MNSLNLAAHARAGHKPDLSRPRHWFESQKKGMPNIFHGRTIEWTHWPALVPPRAVARMAQSGGEADVARRLRAHHPAPRANWWGPRVYRRQRTSRLIGDFDQTLRQGELCTMNSAAERDSRSVNSWRAFDGDEGSAPARSPMLLNPGKTSHEGSILMPPWLNWTKAPCKESHLVL